MKKGIFAVMLVALMATVVIAGTEWDRNGDGYYDRNIELEYQIEHYTAPDISVALENSCLSPIQFEYAWGYGIDTLYKTIYLESSTSFRCYVWWKNSQGHSSYQYMWRGTKSGDDYILNLGSNGGYTDYPQGVRFPNIYNPEGNCGNGYIEASEQCDNGAENGVACDAAYGETCNYCSGICTTQTIQGPYCGDNVVNGPEQCDGSIICSETCTYRVVTPSCPTGYTLQESTCGCVYNG